MTRVSGRLSSPYRRHTTSRRPSGRRRHVTGGSHGRHEAIASAVQAPRSRRRLVARGRRSTRSTRAASPTATATASATCPGSSTTSTTSGPDGLGVDAIWLSPIYPSPGLDLGYDVSDHERVDPLLRDRGRLRPARRGGPSRAGIRVILDLVMNHTSDQHAWFSRVAAAREGPYADWYLWRDPAGSDADGRPLPPNNWVSFFGGPGWEWEPGARPVLPPHVPRRAAGAELAQPGGRGGPVARWSAAGSSAASTASGSTSSTPSSSTRTCRPTRLDRGRRPWDRQVHLYDRDQPDFPELIGRFRAILDEQPGRMSVGELFDGATETAAALTTRPPPRLRLGAARVALDGRGRPGRRSTAREAAFGDGPLADGRPLEPRPAAPRLAPGRLGRRRPTATRSPRPRRSCS